jgi:ketosteroid isomerase-like protein
VADTNSDLIDRSYRAFRENDLEALLAAYHPEAVLDFTHWEGFPDAPVYRGRAGTEQVLRMLRDVFGVFNVQPVEIVATAPDRVLIEARLTIRGKASGAEVAAPPFGQIAEFRDGLIVRVDNYSDLGAARRAAGLTGA